MIKEGFLKPPLDFGPLKEIGRFVQNNAALIWVNGLTVVVLWIVAVLLITRVTTIGWSILLQDRPSMGERQALGLVAEVLASWLFFPILATFFQSP